MVMGHHGCQYDALKPKTDGHDHEWLSCSSLLGEVCQVFANSHCLIEARTWNLLLH
jgi:hypothetical protein